MRIQHASTLLLGNASKAHAPKHYCQEKSLLVYALYKLHNYFIAQSDVGQGPAEHYNTGRDVLAKDGQER